MSPTILSLASLVPLVLAAPAGESAGESGALALPPWTPTPAIEVRVEPTPEPPEPASEPASSAAPAPARGPAPVVRSASAPAPALVPAEEDRVEEALPGTDAAAVNNPALAAGEHMDPHLPGFKPWEVGGFIDVNYSYNSNNPDNHVYRGTSVQPRTGEFSLNHAVAYIRRDAIPGKFSPLFEFAAQGGPAADALVAYEPNPGGANGKFAGPEVWKHLSRANIGFRSRHGTEVVVGLQLSPVGIGVHWSPYNWNYTVTWQLNSVPYYLSGLKLAQTIRDKHQVQLWIVNGWQLLADNNKAPSVMLGYTFTPSDKFNLGEYVWIGPEQADMRPRAWRLFSDTQATYNTERFGVGALFDVGADPRTDLPLSPWQMWMNGAVFTRWRVLGKLRTWDMALRPEFFWDRDGRMFGVPQTLVSAAFTNNVRVFNNLLVRLEYRYDHSTSPTGFFYRGPAIMDGGPGLARDQHTIFFSVAGVFAHRFGGKRG
ncbi:outer membrane beta-barrel protein [Nannocystis sp. ILAH1]|uniref:outer membrane beta-barrel protein n=1 Tax=Nannocystis sp. ILAH1 TaxID=2996789 RepID=UPI002270DDAF|nr:outer membrane beta-barrel protein [Nannocystis sp. ILAH1]MCY0992693.1 outer membrane beta-barrel protein [Nannocystis sp. ILAH1]